MIKGKLEKIIQESLENLKSHSDHFSGAVFEIEGFSGIDHGDYAVTIRNIIEGGLKRGHDFETTKFTQDDGEVILEEIKKHPDFDKIFDRAEFKFPVFFNFFTNKKVLLDELKQVFKKKQNYGFSSGWKDKKVIVEFTDPNPFKEFHIGHLYSNIVGEAISRFSGAVGARVKRINYQGDVGLHVAKAVWGIEQKIVSEKINFAKLESKPLKERIVFLGQAYVLGANAFEEDNTAKEEIVELNKKIFKLDKTIKNVYQKGRRWSLLYFEKIYKRLGTKFDSYYFESEVAPTGEKLVKDGLKRGIFKESEGAIIFPGENYGLHNRVFINSQGLPTYEAKELGLALAKNKDFKYDLSIIITGNEIVEYFKVLIAALEAVLPDLGVKTLHIPHGMVRFSSGKMASRKGNIITAEQLLDNIKDLAIGIVDSSKNLSRKEKNTVVEMVTIGAVKYSWLKNRIGQDIIFDPEQSLNIKGNSGPYLQYTCVRCDSVIRKAKIQKLGSEIITGNVGFGEEEMEIIRTIIRFPEIVVEAAKKFSPNLICNFAFNLAQKYNAFYDRYPIAIAKEKDVRQARLVLTAATAQVLKNALFLLGINVPKRM